MDDTSRTQENKKKIQKTRKYVTKLGIITLRDFRRKFTEIRRFFRTHVIFCAKFDHLNDFFKLRASYHFKV